MATRLWIQGSCVTRTPLVSAPETLVVSRFRARSSVVSLVSPPVPMIPHDAATVPRFEAMNIAADFSKSWRQELPQSGEIAIFDFIDERFGVVDTGEGYFTFSTSLRAVVDRDKILSRGKFISPGSAGYHDLVMGAMDAFCDIISNIPDICVNTAYWAEPKPDGPAFPESLSKLITPQNRLLDAIYDRIAARTKARFFGLAKHRHVAAAEHKWGMAPFHYTQETDLAILQSLTDLVGAA